MMILHVPRALHPLAHLAFSANAPLFYPPPCPHFPYNGSMRESTHHSQAAIDAVAETGRLNGLADSASTFDLIEEAIAKERAVSALELMAEAIKEAPWVKEISIRWRFTHNQRGNYDLRIAPSLGQTEPFGNGVNLVSIIEFSIVAGRLGDGTLREQDAAAIRSNADAMRAAFALAARGEGFSGKTAERFKNKIMVAESELGKALGFCASCRHDIPSWFPMALHQSFDKRIERDASHDAQSLAHALGLQSLAADIESRAIGSSTPDPLLTQRKPTL